MQGKASRLALTLGLALLGCTVAVAGCSQGAGRTSGTAAGTTGASAAAAATRAFGFDAAATMAGTSPNPTLTSVSLRWFPPERTDGLQPELDQQQLFQLTQAAMASPQFWILPSSDSTAPVTFASAARKHVNDSGEFTAGTVVPVAPLLRAPAANEPLVYDRLFGKPTGYQVYLEGPAGMTSFGMTPGGQPGTWALDSRGELRNWPKSIRALARKVGFVPARAAVTHTAFGAGGKRALQLTWAVFPDARGRIVVAALRDLPPTGDVWKLGGDPLHSGAIYPLSSIFSTVTATPGR